MDILKVLGIIAALFAASSAANAERFDGSQPLICASMEACVRVWVRHPAAVEGTAASVWTKSWSGSYHRASDRASDARIMALVR